jgi:hypothetical protein
MKENSEEILEQLLRGLRDAEAPAGMELRILNAIEDRASAASPSKQPRRETSKQSRRGTPWSTPLRFPWPVALGAAATTILLPAILLHHPADRPAPTAIPAQARIQPNPSLTQPHALPTLIAEAVSPPLARKPAQRHAPSLSAQDQLSLRELRTPSHPEPPEPLTAEEKILLHIAHTAAPEEIAMLNPEIRAQQQARSAAEFERFAQSSTNQNQERK